MKAKVRFGDLSMGEVFEWSGKSLKKDGTRTATATSPRSSFIFSSRDMVTIDVPDDDIDEDYMVPGIGYLGTVAPCNPDPIDSFDPYDTYFSGSGSGSYSSNKDKCN